MREFLVMSAYIKQSERPQINRKIIHLKVLGKQKQAKLKLEEERNNNNQS
jgi:hypothetical protein